MPNINIDYGEVHWCFLHMEDVDPDSTCDCFCEMVQTEPEDDKKKCSNCIYVRVQRYKIKED